MKECAAAMADLIALMRALRDPASGCPWDREQNFATIAPYTIEEAYEVSDAIERRDLSSLKAELGDLLFQVVFHAQLAAEIGAFDFADVAAALHDKMVPRHPHVFGDAKIDTADDQSRAWEQHKAKERAGQRTLDGIPFALPGLTRAVKLQRRAAQVGFDWAEAAPILDKLAEEAGELAAEMARGASKARLEDELGDLLFVMANLARHLDVDPEAAIRKTNAKFERRFQKIEDWLAADGRNPATSNLAEMDALWNKAKSLEGLDDGQDDHAHSG